MKGKERKRRLEGRELREREEKVDRESEEFFHFHFHPINFIPPHYCKHSPFHSKQDHET